MSTQNILTISDKTLFNNVDKKMNCLSRDMMNSAKIGLKLNVKSEKIFLLTYVHDILHNPISCPELLGDKENVIKLNNIINNG